MNIAVRYCSRSGNTKALAVAIGDAVGVDAVSVDSDKAAIKEPTNLLFIGGALYAYGIDKRLKSYLQTLRKEDVKKAVVFSTSWLSKHALELIKKALKNAGIETVEETLYFKGRPNEKQLEEAKEFAKRYI